MTDLIQYLRDVDKEVQYLCSINDLDGAEHLSRQACESVAAEAGRNDLKYALRLERLAEVLIGREKHSEARSLLERTLEIRKSVLGPRHTACATTLHKLASVLFRLGDLDGAATYLTDAIEMRSEALGSRHSLIAQMRNDLSVIIRAQDQEKLIPEALAAYNEAREHADLGHLAEAEASFLAAISLNEARLGHSHPHTGMCKKALADLYIQIGQPQQALPLATEAVWIFSFLKETHPISYALALVLLGRVHGRLGRYADAERQLRKAVTLLENAGEIAQEDLAHALNSLGSVELEIGRVAQSALTLGRAAHIFQSLNKVATSDYAAVSANLAFAYTQLGRQHEAEQSYRAALKIKQDLYGESHHSYLTTLGNYGIFLGNVGRRRTAVTVLSKTISGMETIFGKNSPQVIHLLDALGGIAEEQGQPAVASGLFERAAEISNNSRGSNHPSSLFQQLRSARMLIRHNKLESAKTTLDEVESMLENRNLAALQLRCFALQGELALARQDLTKAISYFERATLISESIDSDNYWLAFNNYMRTLIWAGDFDVAISKFDEYAEVVERAFHNIAGLFGDSNDLATLPNILLECALTLLWHKGDQYPHLIAATFGHILRYRACTLDVLAARNTFASMDSDGALLTQLRGARTQLHELVLSDPIPGLEDRYLSDLANTKEELHSLEQQLMARLSEDSKRALLPSVSLVDLDLALPLDNVLIEFIRFKPLAFDDEEQDQYLAFTYERSRGPRCIKLCSAEEVEKWLYTWRDETAVPPEARLDDYVLKTCKEKLADLLVDPVFNEFAGRRVWIVPDGELWHVPFEALPTKDGTYLGDVCTIGYLAVSRDLVRLNNVRPRDTTDPIIVADPDFDLKDDSDAELRRQARMDAEFEQYELGNTTIPTAFVTYPDSEHFWEESGLEPCRRLPGTRKEAEEISRILNVVPVLGNDALDTHLKQIRRPRILHLATHGFFLDSPEHWRDLSFKRDLYGLERSMGASMAKYNLRLREHLRRLTHALSEDVEDNDRDDVSTADDMSTDPFQAHFDDPLLCSGLLLAGANTWLANGPWANRAEDGIFTAQDVLGLDLTSTELVVLSACDTGRGEIRNSEGVFGLRRAFTIAGARTLIMSLWRVSDEVTQGLMIHFYSELACGRGCGDALRSAKMKVRSVYSDPFYWAAFVCQGDQGTN